MGAGGVCVHATTVEGFHVQKWGKEVELLCGNKQIKNKTASTPGMHAQENIEFN
jgi:hypothetical protein